VKLRKVGRVAAILGTALTFLVGTISIVLGVVNSSPDQGGGSLVVRGLVLVALSLVAGYAASISIRKPKIASIQLVMVTVLGSVVAFRSFWIAACVLIVSAAIVYLGRENWDVSRDL
jgi:hypothetical protein